MYGNLDILSSVLYTPPCQSSLTWEGEADGIRRERRVVLPGGHGGGVRGLPAGDPGARRASGRGELRPRDAVGHRRRDRRLDPAAHHLRDRFAEGRREDG